MLLNTGSIEGASAVAVTGLTSDRIDFSFGDAHSFIGAAAFGHHAGEIRSTGVIQMDTDGDGAANVVLVLDNHALLTAADFGL